jgi:hypothetical protein
MNDENPYDLKPVKPVKTKRNGKKDVKQEPVKVPVKPSFVIIFD